MTRGQAADETVAQQVQAACWLCPGWRRVSDRRPESTASPGIWQRGFFIGGGYVPAPFQA